MKKDFLKTCGGLAVFFLVAGVAGHYDHLDEKVAEMKNDGSYYELSERCPHASDEELVALRDSIEEAQAAVDALPAAAGEDTPAAKADSAEYFYVEGCGK